MPCILRKFFAIEKYSSRLEFYSDFQLVASQTSLDEVLFRWKIPDGKFCTQKNQISRDFPSSFSKEEKTPDHIRTECKINLSLNASLLHFNSFCLFFRFNARFSFVSRL